MALFLEGETFGCIVPVNQQKYLTVCLPMTKGRQRVALKMHFIRDSSVSPVLESPCIPL